MYKTYKVNYDELETFLNTNITKDTQIVKIETIWFTDKYHVVMVILKEKDNKSSEKKTRLLENMGIIKSQENDWFLFQTSEI